MSDFMCNKFNFAIIPCDINSNGRDLKNISSVFYVKDSRELKFCLSIPYSLILTEKDVEKLSIKVEIMYLSDTNDIKKNLCLTILEKDLMNQEIINNIKPIDGNEIFLPSPAETVFGGMILIRYKSGVPGFGKYQLNVYYKLNTEESYTLADVYPIEVLKS